jgi:hypothetical protein
MLQFARNLFGKKTESPGLTFSRPLVLLQSDDWGRVGVRDKEGYELLRSHGLRLGEHPYDLYTLESADDVSALASLLKKHRDSTGRASCLTMNFCTANLDFKAMQEHGFNSVKLLPLARGLPGSWSRPGLIEAYREGIEGGIFWPSLHGLTHFCPAAVENALRTNGDRSQLLRLLWNAETPFIYWRMPWIGYEYWDPEKRGSGFLPPTQQRELVTEACEYFSALFGTRAISACAPGYRANRDTVESWSQAGIKVAQSGTGSGLKAPHMDEFGILHIYRTLDFEPSQREPDMEKCLQIAGICFDRGLPFVISVHAINFHSSLKDFRTGTLAALDSLLTELEAKYPKLLYVNDQHLHQIVTEGAFGTRSETVSVSPDPHWQEATRRVEGLK